MSQAKPMSVVEVACAPSVRSLQILQKGAAWLSSIVLIGVLAVLVALPLGAVAIASLLTHLPFSSSTDLAWTLSNYRALWTVETLDALVNSLIVSIGGTFIAMLTGGLLAWLATRTDAPGKPLFYAVGIGPLFMSLAVVAMTWSFIASGRTGYLNIIAEALGIRFRVEAQSLAGITIIQGLYYAPYAFLMLYNALALINPEIEEAAEIHGANTLDIMRRVTFPLVRPAMIGAGILVFVAGIEDFPVPAILGGPVGVETLSVHIYKLFTRAPAEPNQAAAVSIVLTIIVCGMIWLQRAALHGKDYRTVTGKGRRQRLIPLGWFRWPAFGSAALYGFVVLGLPLFGLFIGSMRTSLFVRDAASLFDPAQMSLVRMTRTLSSPALLSAAENSFIAAFGVATFGVALYFIAAYMAQKTRAPGRASIDYLAIVPLGLPSLVLGLGILWTWLAMPFPVYGTMAMFVIAFVARFLPQGYRSISGSLTQIHDELEEAALMAGASRMTTIWRVTLPLLKGALVSTALLTAILSVRELTVSLFLYTTKTKVLSIIIFEAYDNGNWSSVAIISFVYTIVLLLLTVISHRWVKSSL